MKKQVLIIISIVVIICSFVACTHNSGSESISTTAVTTINSKSEIEKTYDSSTSAKNEADNIVNFESEANSTTVISTTKTQKETSTTNIDTTDKISQPVTDKDGWINKWY